MTIAVIGHGRSPEGKGWGSKIDECSHVVRMWDWHPWQHPRDYGERYDYGLFVLTPKGLFMFWKHNQRQPKRGWLAYFGKPTAGPLPYPVEVLRNTEWNEHAESLGGAGESGKFTLTRGAAAAMWAIEQHKGWRHSLCMNKVVLVGFDNVCLGVNQPIDQSFCPEYWNLYMSRFKPDVEKVYPLGASKTATHDMSFEKGFLQSTAKLHSVELSFAQDVW